MIVSMIKSPWLFPLEVFNFLFIDMQGLKCL